MNFGEKLTDLRKQKGLSQEELGEELNVTRQTISKWELGQTSPDTAKLTEIANYFNVGVNELTNEEEIKFDSANEDKEVENKKTSAGVIVLIIILVLALIGIIYYVVQVSFINSIFNTGKTIKNKAEQVLDGFDNTNSEGESTQGGFLNKFNDAVNSTKEEHNKNSFNMWIEDAQGTKSKFMLSSYLDEIVTSNKTNKEHTITVIYKETTTAEEDKIVEIKHSLDDKNKYEVSVDYDENGYINKVTIKDI